MNTALLFILLKRKLPAATGPLLRRAAAYTLKILLFSTIAAVPVILIRKPLAAFVATLTASRLPQNLIPFLLCAVLFAATGILLLTLTRDPHLPWRRNGGGLR